MGGFEESPRKQLAVPDPNDRPTVYSARDQGSPFMHTVNRYEPRPEAPNTFVGNEPMSRGGKRRSKIVFCCAVIGFW